MQGYLNRVYVGLFTWEKPSESYFNIGIARNSLSWQATRNPTTGVYTLEVGRAAG